jgi:hypothetical protein
MIPVRPKYLWITPSEGSCSDNASPIRDTAVTDLVCSSMGTGPVRIARYRCGSAIELSRPPLSPGRAERHGFEYYRHGTLALIAALDVGIGKVNEKPSRHTSGEFLRFLDRLVARGRAARKSASFSISCARTRARQCARGLRSIRLCTSTLRGPTARGSIRWNSGLPRSSAR